MTTTYAATSTEASGPRSWDATSSDHQRGPWDDHNWLGWWGDSPPFHTPVFVLTHHERPSFTLDDTTFRFLDATPNEAIERATKAADGLDVRIGGGPTTIRSFLDADLVDDMHIVVAPLTLESEIAEHDKAMVGLLSQVAPQLLAERGVAHVTAAIFVMAWSHHGRCRSEAAYARLAGAAPIPSTSGRTQDRHRLNHGGDRRLNHALYIVAMTRLRCDPETQAYRDRGIAEGKTHREIVRCLKRYIARRVWRLLEHPPPPQTSP